MVDINKIVEIDPLNDAEYRPLLRDLQGNIIKGNGRENAVHLFLQFKDGQQDQVKEWLGEFTRKYVTSAWAQAYEAKEYRENQTKGSVFTNVFLTVFGYDYLGLIGDELPFSDDFFLGGMKDPNSQIGFADPTVDKWDAGLQQTFHGLIMMADDDLEGLLHVVDQVIDSFSAIADIVHRDDGFVLRNKDNKVIEHFGFRDGVSQPLFVIRDIETERKFDPTNFSNWDPRAPLSLVLLKDPFGKTPDSYGSYLVYRKLEQNVPGWNNDVVNNLAPALKDEPALAGAYTMGRFQDGTPVVLTDSAMGADTNNFNYLNDTTGSKCPFHSHIRKTNPRGDTGSLISTEIPLKEEKMHRIVRRAVSYGEQDRDQALEKGSGLLFLCFQGNITNQFAFMQKRWANTPGFIEPGTGTDPVISPGTTESYNWPKTWGSTERTQADFSHWVNFKGGEFFFTPSLSFLESLNEDSVSQKRLKVKHSGKVLNLADPSSDTETNAIQSTFSNSNSEVWLLEEAGEGYYFIRNKHSGLVLTVQSVSGDAQVQNVYATIKYGGDAQLWQTVDNHQGYYHIVSKTNNKVLDVTGSSQDDGANVIVYPQTTSDNQLWQLENV